MTSSMSRIDKAHETPTSNLFNKFINFKKTIDISNRHWEMAESNGITNINASLINGPLMETEDAHQFYHMCTTSYLGLDSHPRIIQGAIDTIQKQGILRIPSSKNRCKLAILKEFEEQLGTLFGSHAICTLSCSAASAAVLPILASGYFTNNLPPVMIFDKNAHFSMNIIKPICNDETQVLTCPNNDLNFVEDICKRNKEVVYVSDGVYSMGGCAPLDGLKYLKEKYGLFLYLDDSHSLSIKGQFGEGYVKNYFGELNHRMIIVASLAKAFGGSGGLIMLGAETQKNIINRFGGPNLWSQSLNAAGIGAGLASIQLHRSQELHILQKKLQTNIATFDKLINTEQSGNEFPVRLITCGDSEAAIPVANKLMKAGFFVSAVFFPIVKRGTSALRIMLRADMNDSILQSFSQALNASL